MQVTLKAPHHVVYQAQKSRRISSRSALEERQIAHVCPSILLLVAGLALCLPSSKSLVAASLIAGIVSLRTLFLQVFRPGHLRFSWLLATGLLLGYGLGTCNTALQVLADGRSLSAVTGHDIDALCSGLTVSLVVCAAMYFVGYILEPAMEGGEWVSVNSGILLSCAGFALVAVAYATGGIGYMGASEASNKGAGSSPLSAFAELFVPALPPFTAMLAYGAKTALKSRLLWLLFAIQAAALLPQGRQVLIYTTVLVFTSLTLAGLRFRIASVQTVLLLLTAAATLYVGNKFFYAMRYERNQVGHKTTIGLLQNMKDASEIVISGDQHYASALTRNLQLRTFILGYFSDLLEASWTHPPLLGRAAVFNIRMSIPSAFDPGKQAVLDLGAEETIVNPEFGLKVRDEANNILTSGLADFGLVGCFCYPMLLCMGLSRIFRISSGRLPPAISFFLFLCLGYTLLHAETATGVFFITCRNLFLITVVLMLVFKSNSLVDRSIRQRRSKSTARSFPGLASMLLAAFLLTHTLFAEDIKPGRTVAPQMYDPNCGKQGYNCRAAFQKALSDLRSAKGGTLQLPAGNFFLDFPEIPSNTKNGPTLNRNSLILVAPNTLIQGHIGPDGKPDTFIEWSQTSVPVFVFADASSSGLQNLHFRFTGFTASNYPYGDVSLLKALDFQVTRPHFNQMSGGNYEMSSVVYLFNSERCTFDNISFDSRTHDNSHVLGFAFNAKGKGVIVEGGAGGISGLASGNRFSRISVHDYVMGLLFSGQEDLTVTDVVADRRGSTMDIAPGHVIYVAAGIRFDPAGKLTVFSNKNLTLRNINEGSNSYSNIHSGGTLALKYIDGGVVSHVVSHHPVGLIQTLGSDQNMTFTDLTWESDYRLCDNAPREVCSASVINSFTNNKDVSEPPLENLTFRHISLRSTHEPITCTIMGNHIVIQDLVIETPPFLKSFQANTAAVLNIKYANGVSITGYKYLPILDSVDPAKRYNAPFGCWVPCKDVKGTVEIKWPSSVPVPPNGSPVLKSVFQEQEKDPEKHISIDTKVTPL